MVVARKTQKKSLFGSRQAEGAKLPQGVFWVWKPDTRNRFPINASADTTASAILCRIYQGFLWRGPTTASLLINEGRSWQTLFIQFDAHFDWENYKSFTDSFYNHLIGDFPVESRKMNIHLNPLWVLFRKHFWQVSFHWARDCMGHDSHHFIANLSWIS